MPAAVRWTRLVAAAQLACVFPAALFLTAVLIGTGDAPQYDLARAARQVVTWYTARGWTLGVLLLALPFAVLLVGSGALMRMWRARRTMSPADDAPFVTIQAPLAALFIAWTTLTSAGILGIVALHMLAN